MKDTDKFSGAFVRSGALIGKPLSVIEANDFGMVSRPTGDALRRSVDVR